MPKLIYAIELSELRENAVKSCSKIKCRDELQVVKEIQEIERLLIRRNEDDEILRRTDKLEQLYDEMVCIKDCQRAKSLIQLADSKKNTGNFDIAECYYNKAILIIKKVNYVN